MKYCSRCGCNYQIQPSYTGKIVALGISGLFAKSTTKNPWITFGIMAISTVIGDFIDKKISESCPKCGMVLQVLSDIGAIEQL